MWSALLRRCLQNSKIIFWGRRACLTGVCARAYACMRILIILCIIVLYVRVWLQYVAKGKAMCQPTALSCAARHDADRTPPPTSLARLVSAACRRRFNGFTGALNRKATHHPQRDFSRYYSMLFIERTLISRVRVHTYVHTYIRARAGRHKPPDLLCTCTSAK